uniref:Uncharacterized protein n=1 Tax=Mimivirus LCMiAC01 TaxID=2506608 RepID=A0A481YZV5_9VIRU|nr:MAG: hypothetical protein LCMiAC01_01180 [Mimivirus LCMiAC01]
MSEENPDSKLLDENKDNSHLKNETTPMMVEIDGPGDIDDILIKPVNEKTLTKLLDIIYQKDIRGINKLIMSLGDDNSINPNKNIYHSCSQEYMIKYYIDKKLSEQKCSYSSSDDELADEA